MCGIADKFLHSIPPHLPFLLHNTRTLTPLTFITNILSYSPPVAPLDNVDSSRFHPVSTLLLPLQISLSPSTLDVISADLPGDIMIFDEGLDSIDITLNDVCDQLSCLETSKSYGPDNISPRFLRDGGIVLAESLCKLYKMSIKLSKVVKQWRLANTVLIHKKESQNFRTHHCPISLLSLTGKGIERIVFKHVFNFFRGCFIISIYQSGFLPGVSTVTSLIEVYHSFSKQ